VRTIFAAAKANGIQVVTLAPTDDLAATASLGAVDGVTQLIQADLDAGRTVVVPERQVEIEGTPRIGWWTIDPATGQIIDRMDTGGSAAVVMYQELAEYITVLRNGMAHADQWRRLGCTGAVITMLAAMLLGAPFAGYKAAQAGMACNYGEAVITATGGEIAGVVAFIRAPAACLV